MNHRAGVRPHEVRLRNAEQLESGAITLLQTRCRHILEVHFDIKRQSRVGEIADRDTIYIGIAHEGESRRVRIKVQEKCTDEAIGFVHQVGREVTESNLNTSYNVRMVIDAQGAGALGVPPVCTALNGNKTDA